MDFERGVPMQIQISASKIYLASEAVDFRKSIHGLTALVMSEFNQVLENQIYIFFNRAKNRLKLLARHRNGSVLIYKALDKKKFILKESDAVLYEVSEQQLSWLLAGLDWVTMSEFNESSFTDYF